MLSCVPTLAATYDIEMHYPQADSLRLIVSTPSSTDTSTAAPSSSIDTSITISDVGLYQVWVDLSYSGDWVSSQNDYLYGDSAVATSYRFRYLFETADSVYLIHDNDTTWYTSVTEIDSTFTVSEGLEVFLFGIKYAGESEWVAGTYYFNNIVGGGVGPAPGVDFVTLYIDIGTGAVTSGGAMTPWTRIEARLNLIGEENLMYSTTWGIVPEVYIGTPSSGRITFRVPANTKLTPTGSYYELSFKTYSRYSSYTRKYMNFIVDTLPDPLNILEATRVR